MIDVQDPDRHHVADRDDVVRTFHIFIRQLADMRQAGVFEADVDERAEVDDVEDGPLEFHAGGEVFEFKDAGFEDRFGEVVARIAVGSFESVANVLEGFAADGEFVGDFGDVDFGEFAAEIDEFFLVEDDARVEAEPFEQVRGGFVAFGVDPGAVERGFRRQRF